LRTTGKVDDLGSKNIVHTKAGARDDEIKPVAKAPGSRVEPREWAGHCVDGDSGRSRRLQHAQSLCLSLLSERMVNSIATRAQV
jgi:hypothetical protein